MSVSIEIFRFFYSFVVVYSSMRIYIYIYIFETNANIEIFDYYAFDICKYMRVKEIDLIRNTYIFIHLSAFIYYLKQKTRIELIVNSNKFFNNSNE